MALIIKAQMPKSCEWTDKTSRTGMGYCPLKDKCMAYREEVSKQYTINAHPIDYIPSDCPIIGEIPDKHGRLIDADAFWKRLQKQTMSLWTEKSKEYQYFLDVMDMIKSAPTIVEATNE